ncbi:MAG TPA: hypothetical protein VI643_01785 [Planctomycetota bacterium]|nr:hypothetical protein [Planctomycetota bacterium]
MARKKNGQEKACESRVDPYREMWMSLTPGERLRRAWALRRRLKNIQAIHDAKYLPEP